MDYHFVYELLNIYLYFFTNSNASYVENLQQNENHQKNYSVSILYIVYILVLPKIACRIQSFGKPEHWLRLKLQHAGAKDLVKS